MLATSLSANEEIDAWSYDVTVPLDDDVEEDEEIPDYVLEDEGDGVEGEDGVAQKGGSKKRLAVERFDGEPVGETETMPLLLEAGFLAGPRRAV